ncbi:MAG TPA: M1 family aminopeptidase [Bryobacteraceae bacterium]
MFQRDLRSFSAVVFVVLSSAAFAQTAPDGIPRALAQSRAARVSDLHYDLNFTLIPHAANAAATEKLTFNLSDASQPLLVDFRDGAISSLTLNGTPVPAAIEHGHLILPTADLRTGLNTVESKFTANIGAAGKAITRFDDKDDGSEYLYTLFVPMDASMAFPCFDQPDLKGRFKLSLTHPTAWSVISNTAPSMNESMGAASETHFHETDPIPTYLFAFAAGPFVNVHPTPGLPNVWVRKSKAAAAESEVPEVQTTAADGIRYLSAYFAQPFPFPKYEMVLIPGFAYGGMEHAGATFLREESVLFRTAPTADNRLGRQILVLHELTHQWFGDFTTMRWFDDLWLKEGFAQYMAYHALADLRPHDAIWQHFYLSIKPGAYAIDETQGTTPIYQDIPNLDDAKSAYGAIVYSKAPAVLRQLNYILGEAAFRRGLQIYLAEHKYGNATWQDLIDAFQSASGRNLAAWSDRWIRHRGMPRIDTSWTCSNGHLASLRLTQAPVLGGSDIWPIATEIALGYPDGSVQTLRADLKTQSAEIPLGPAARQCPQYVFSNHDDHAYGLFPLDAKSRAALLPQLASHGPAASDLFRRTLLWGSLWDSVRLTDFDPALYTRTALSALPAEHDESLAASLLAHTETSLHRYLSTAAQHELLLRAAALAADRSQNEPDHDLRIVWFRSLTGLSTEPNGRAVLKDLLNGTRTIPGVTFRQQDRWSLVSALIAYNDPDANAVFAAEQKRDPSGDGLKYAWVAQAARPDAATKQHYFDEYLHNPDRSEDWIESSLGAFNEWNQSALTAPYIDPALAALPQIKRERKIFFLVAWLDAFLDNQQSPASLATVENYLKTQHPDPDLRLKILQAEDELHRTVTIRAKYTHR